jgi:hypothetical protein
MGANADETELVILWNKLLNINWQRHPDMNDKLRYVAHENGSRLTIGYLFDGRTSKRFFTDEDDSGVSNLTRITSFVGSYFSGCRFLWHANKGAEIDGFASADRLPMVSHGVNRPHFVSCHNVALMSAFNRYPAAYRFMQLLGIEEELAHTMIAHQSDYQAMMRCSLRDPVAVAPVNVLVGNRASAEWIASKFPGCKVVKVESGIDEPRKAGRPASMTPAKTATERSRARRERLKAVKELKAGE